MSAAHSIIKAKSCSPVFRNEVSWKEQFQRIIMEGGVEIDFPNVSTLTLSLESHE